MPATYVNIASQTLGSSAASVTFSSIPNTYTDIVLRMSLRNDGAATLDNTKLQFNGDASSANYSWTFLRGNGATASSGRTATGVVGYIQLNANTIGTAGTANTFASSELYVPSYTSTAKKPVFYFGAEEANATTANLYNYAGLYHGTSAISSITLTPVGAYNFATGSTFYLYGIKNS